MLQLYCKSSKLVGVTASTFASLIKDLGSFLMRHNLVRCNVGHQTIVWKVEALIIASKVTQIGDEALPPYAVAANFTEKTVARKQKYHRKNS